MNATTMNTDLHAIKSLLKGTKFTADRCRHESVEETTVWIFNEKQQQIGVIARLPKEEITIAHAWRVSYVHSGLPETHVRVPGLTQAIEHLTLFDQRYTR